MQSAVQSRAGLIGAIALAGLAMCGCEHRSPSGTEKAAVGDGAAAAHNPSNAQNSNDVHSDDDHAVPVLKTSDSNANAEKHAADSAAAGDAQTNNSNRRPTVAPMSSSKLSATVTNLERIWMPYETDPVVAQLTEQDDDAVAEIGRQLVERTPNFGRVHQSVRVLQAVNSEKSRELLYRIAMGEGADGNPNLEAWAAQALVRCDPNSAWTMLSSPNLQVLTTVLNGLENQPIDSKRLQLLKHCLENENGLVSWRAAEIMSGAPAGKLASEAVEAMVQALSNVASIPNINDVDKRSWLDGGHTLGEEYYRRYAGALEHAKVADQALHAIAERLQGRDHDVVILALARRSDKSVHDEIIKIAQDPDAELLRVWAVNAMRIVGTSDDLPMLQRLADSDPLVRPGMLPPPHPVDSMGPTYPVREAAKSTIRAIQK